MKPSHDARTHARGGEGYHPSRNVERGPRQGERGRECCVANVRVGSKARITATQHCCPIHRTAAELLHLLVPTTAVIALLVNPNDPILAAFSLFSCGP